MLVDFRERDQRGALDDGKVSLLDYIFFSLQQQVAELNGRTQRTAQLVREVLSKECHHQFLVFQLLCLKKVSYIVEVD